MDIWVMLDVNINNVGPVTDYSEVKPFNDAKFYHKKCDIADTDN